MSEYLTWEAMWDRMSEGEMDLAGTDFVDEEEVKGFANDAIDEAESLIHTIYEDYFLDKAYLTLVNGEEDVDLPTNIYAMKIRAIIYDNGSSVYEIKRIRELKKFLQYRLAKQNTGTSGTYSYFLTNATAGEPKVTFSPPAQEDSTENVEVWFLRNANRLTFPEDKCDIPEFVQFIYDYVRVKVYTKEGHFALPVAQQALAETRQRMIATLTEMVPDNDNEMQPDLSFYREHN